MLKYDEINIVKDFWPLFVKTTHDFGDFMQIILYFRLSTNKVKILGKGWCVQNRFLNSAINFLQYM